MSGHVKSTLRLVHFSHQVALSVISLYYYRATHMIAQYMLWHCLSVCLLHPGVVSKLLNMSSTLAYKVAWDLGAPYQKTSVNFNGDHPDMDRWDE